MSTSRTRLAAVAGSLALSLSLVSAPAVMAQDGPEATIEGLMAAIEAKDFEGLPSFFCAEFADQMGVLDLGSLTEGLPPGMDVNTLLDAFILDTEIASMEVLSQSDTEAVVRVDGSITMDIDVEAMGPFIEALLEMSGMEVTPEMVEMVSGPLMSEFEAESTQISDEITLVPGEDGGWLICDELSAFDDVAGDETADESMAPGMADESMAPASE
jgi:hypothetical protein